MAIGRWRAAPKPVRLSWALVLRLCCMSITDRNHPLPYAILCCRTHMSDGQLQLRGATVRCQSRAFRILSKSPRRCAGPRPLIRWRCQGAKRHSGQRGNLSAAGRRAQAGSCGVVVVCTAGAGIALSIRRLTRGLLRLSRSSNRVGWRCLRPASSSSSSSSTNGPTCGSDAVERDSMTRLPINELLAGFPFRLCWTSMIS